MNEIISATGEKGEKGKFLNENMSATGERGEQGEVKQRIVGK